MLTFRQIAIKLSTRVTSRPHILGFQWSRPSQYLAVFVRWGAVEVACPAQIGLHFHIFLAWAVRKGLVCEINSDQATPLFAIKGPDHERYLLPHTLQGHHLNLVTSAPLGTRDFPSSCYWSRTQRTSSRVEMHVSNLPLLPVHALAD